MRTLCAALQVHASMSQQVIKTVSRQWSEKKFHKAAAGAFEFNTRPDNAWTRHEKQGKGGKAPATGSPGDLLPVAYQVINLRASSGAAEKLLEFVTQVITIILSC